jgi:hypothetical protein
LRTVDAPTRCARTIAARTLERMTAAEAQVFTNRATFFVPSLLLFADPEPANDAVAKPVERVVPQYKWIHCANEGLYRGHHQGEFNLTRAVFEQFVTNFRSHPQYRAGNLDLEGKTYTGGVRSVIQFDYEHASEMPSWEGSIPSTGAPAPAWVLDVELRQGADGKTQLWAFGKLGDQIRGQIQREEILFVSIAFTLSGVHWINGMPIGAVLTSIAFTNHPFMLDLEPLAAANRQTGAPLGSRVKPSGDPSEAPGERNNSQPTGDRTMSDQLRERVCKALKIRTLVDDDAVGAAVEEAASGAGNLESLLEALGVDKPDDAMKVIPVLRDARDKLAAYVAELDALLQQEVAADAALAPTDVGAAMSAQNLQGEGAKKAMLAYRAQCIREELAPLGDKPKLSDFRTASAKARTRFLGEYGVKEGSPGTQRLTHTLVAGPNGMQVQPPVIPLGADDDRDTQVIDLTGLAGRNTTEKLMSYLSKKEPGFDKLPAEVRIKRAGAIKRSAQLTQ